MTTNAILDVENRIKSITSFSTNLGQQNIFKSALNPFIIHDAVSPRYNSSNSIYHILDFRDFIDYATSPIASSELLGGILNDHYYFYDGIEGCANNPMIDISEQVGFSISGAAIARHDPFVTIAAVLKMHSKDGYTEEVLLLLHLCQDKYPSFQLVEWDRYLIFFPTKEDNEYRIEGYGEYCNYIKDHILSDLTKKHLPISTRLADFLSSSGIETSRRTLYEKYSSAYEIARLFLLLPSYYAFMYDLVVEEKRVAGKKKKIRSKGKKKVIKSDIIYKIIRSIRVTYLGDEEISSPTNRRSWSAPAYRYAVRGHWRVYQENATKGHDAEGKVIIGKTWAREYQKGPNEKLPEHQVLQRDPQCIVFIKEALAEGRDKLMVKEKKDYQRLKSKEKEANPTKEWMYNERKKLTAGLRYLVLKRDEFKCGVCGADAASETVRLEVDHIIPISRWGTTEIGNLQTVCSRCNKGKSNKD